MSAKGSPVCLFCAFSSPTVGREGIRSEMDLFKGHDTTIYHLMRIVYLVLASFVRPSEHKKVNNHFLWPKSLLGIIKVYWTWHILRVWRRRAQSSREAKDCMQLSLWMRLCFDPLSLAKILVSVKSGSRTCHWWKSVLLSGQKAGETWLRYGNLCNERWFCFAHIVLCETKWLLSFDMQPTQIYKGCVYATVIAVPRTPAARIEAGIYFPW